MVFLLVLFSLLAFDAILFACDKYWYSLIVMVVSATLFWPTKPVQELVTTYGIQNIIMYGLPAYLVIGVVVAAIKWLIFATSISNIVATHNVKFNQQYAPNPERLAQHLTSYGERFGLEFSSVDAARSRLVWTEAQLAEMKRISFILYMKVDVGLHNVLRYPANIDQLIRANFVTSDNSGLIELLTPNTKNYIPRITSWVIQWPVVIVATLLQDILFKIGNLVASAIEAAFSKYSQRQITKAIKGL